MALIIEKIKLFSQEIKLMLYGVCLFLEIDQNIIKILFFLMLIDTFLGVVKNVVLKGTFSLKILLFGFVSKLAIILIPVTLALMGKGMNYNFNVFVTVAIDLLLVSEGISIFSNGLAIKTKKEVENFDAITLVIKAIRTALINLFKGLSNNIQKPT